ncbi:type II toxin-antitoxin system RelE/ParE family toxin [Stenotrophomonas indicatrix]|uniref:Putative addiction module killer protein n=1 Tax=Stenotrophomonas indicatrix TaxID=2045451 RepID=A0A1W1H380_9GAMM|nr:type II toxin-antitoxin system RelE/ParE family toxin [Stenotrophomonas indicatrix]SLM25961.1 putative addiction module killer protein [Stenotrophomonas indicatrix]
MAACVHYSGHVARIQTTTEFNSWLNGLRDKQGRQRIAVRITRLALGNPGKHRVLAGGIAELKIDFGPAYRIYYTQRAGITYILLCGGDKDSQSRDIEQARKLASLL